MKKQSMSYKARYERAQAALLSARQTGYTFASMTVLADALGVKLVEFVPTAREWADDKRRDAERTWED